MSERLPKPLDDSPGLRDRLAGAALAVGMRNRIAHGYDTVDHKIVFDTVTSSFPLLVQEL